MLVRRTNIGLHGGWSIPHHLSRTLIHSLVIKIDILATVTSVRANPGTNARTSSDENSRPRAPTEGIHQMLNYLRGG